MKLKSTVAVPALPTTPGTESSGAPFPTVTSPVNRATARPPAGYAAPVSAPPPSVLFEAFVRKMIGRAECASAAGDGANVINGTVVAQTHVEGVRYVMVRCEPKPSEALLSLSPRERDIVKLIIKGYPNKLIADMLEISAWTVGTHLRRIFAKLGVTSRAAMVARYLHHVGE